MIKNFASTSNLGRAEALSLMKLAEEIRAQQNLLLLRNYLAHRTVANVFYEDSTRTRISFELAAKRLGADVVNFSTNGSSVSKGETFHDTIATLDAMGLDAVVLRSPVAGASIDLIKSGVTQAAVINAGDGTNEHPTQALLDALTIRESFSLSGEEVFDGLSVLITGDIRHSRVARSNAFLLSTLGAKVTLCAPTNLLPEESPLDQVRLTNDFDEALATGPDVVMMLRVQKERMDQTLMQTTDEYVDGYQLSTTRALRLPSQSIVMHPGPMIRELEISSEVADGSRSVIRNQVTNGVFARMAVLYSTITGGTTLHD